MAQDAEIASEIERLALHCRPPIMDAAERVAWLEDWCEDLRAYPIDPIRAACTRWRQGADRKFPGVGQLRAMIADAMQQAPARPTADYPVTHGVLTRAALRAALVDALGEAFAFSYFDRSAYHEIRRVLEPWSYVAGERLHDRAAVVLNRLNVTLGGPKAVPLRPKQSPEERARIAGMLRDLGAEIAAKAEAKSAKAMSYPKAKPDATGLTPQMRAHMARQQGQP